MDCIKTEMDETETPTSSVKEEFPNNTPMQPRIKRKVKTETYDDNLHVHNQSEMPTGSIKTESFGDSEDSVSCEASIVNDGEDDGNDDDDDVVTDYIKDEIDIDETPIFEKEFSSGIPDTPVQPVIPKADRVNEDVENDEHDDENELIDTIKDEIDIDETPIFKKEFSSGIPDTPVLPVMPKSEPLESNINWESVQFYYGMELEICGRIAVVRLCRWEEDEHNLIVTKSEPSDCDDEFQERNYKKNSKNRIVYPRRARRSAIREDSSDDNDEGRQVEGGPAMKSLREYRMTRARPIREQDPTIPVGGSNTTYKCGKCKFMCHKKTSFKVHLKKHNAKKDICEICGYVSSDAGSLKVHHMIHTGEKPYECDLCDYKCAKKQHLKRHVKRRHTGERPFCCTFCDSKFFDNGVLTKHMRVHIAPRETCNVCNLTFSTNYLKEHQRFHTEVKTYHCDMCEFKSFTSANLRDHKRIHTNNYLRCTECNYKCISHGNFSTHRKLHRGEKPYRCDTCGYRCIRFNHLKQHIRTHTGEKPYSCEQCDEKFTTSSSLNNHRKKTSCLAVIQVI